MQRRNKTFRQRRNIYRILLKSGFMFETSSKNAFLTIYLTIIKNACPPQRFNICPKVVNCRSWISLTLPDGYRIITSTPYTKENHLPQPARYRWSRQTVFVVFVIFIKWAPNNERHESRSLRVPWKPQVGAKETPWE
jgi:hypothetical protein